MRKNLFTLLFVAMPLFLPQQTIAAYPSLFNTTETPSTNLKPFFKWTGMLNRFTQTRPSEKKCIPNKNNSCHGKKWSKFLSTLKGKDARSQLDTVNRHMNESDYILDIINWGVQDYWATPYQFFLKDGDCEDYAIVKYMSLKSLGFSPDRMRIVILQDTNLGVIHAVLAVYINGEAMILDNQISQVVSSNRVHHYSPIYSINENGWWRHRKN